MVSKEIPVLRAGGTEHEPLQGEIADKVNGRGTNRGWGRSLLIGKNGRPNSTGRHGLRARAEVVLMISQTGK
jgi:hypothetical protein